MLHENDWAVLYNVSWKYVETLIYTIPLSIIVSLNVILSRFKMVLPITLLAIFTVYRPVCIPVFIQNSISISLLVFVFYMDTDSQFCI